MEENHQKIARTAKIFGIYVEIVGKFQLQTCSKCRRIHWSREAQKFLEFHVEIVADFNCEMGTCTQKHKTIVIMMIKRAKRENIFNFTLKWLQILTADNAQNVCKS